MENKNNLNLLTKSMLEHDNYLKNLIRICDQCPEKSIYVVRRLEVEKLTDKGAFKQFCNAHLKFR